jgi:hypothetical protein
MRTIAGFGGTVLVLGLVLVSVRIATADPPPKPEEDKLKRLLEERRDALKEEYGLLAKVARGAPELVPLERRCALLAELLEADLHLKQTPSERMDSYKFTIEELSKLEKEEKARNEMMKSAITASNYLCAKENRLKVEIKMTKEQMKQNAK